MARIDENSLINYQNGMVVTAEHLKRDREVLVTAINNNSSRVQELEDNLDIPQTSDANWEATEGQNVFFLPDSETYSMGTNSLEVVVEGFELTEGEEFEELTNNSFKISLSTISAGTRVYARWSNIRKLKLFTEDLQSYIIMGVM